jgi:hypothetical protein
MNADQRKTLAKVAAQIAHHAAMLDDLRSELEQTREDEQDKFDNMPEGLQQGERGQAIEEAVSTLEEAISSLEEAIGSAEEAASSIENL